MSDLRDLGRAAASSLGLRARRWDAIVLGSGLPGLVAAARLGMAGHRVLLVEEEATRALPEAVREPFFLAGANDGGVLDQLLRDLAVPLIDRRRILAEPLAFQLVGPDLRMDVGEASLTVEELVAWGRAKPDEARQLIEALARAGDAQRAALLETPLVRVGRRLALSRSAPAPPPRPDEPALGPGPAELLAAQDAALHHLARATPGAEARARLRATPLAGGACFDGPPPWLHGVLRRRAESVYVEFRALSGGFELVSAQGDPAILVEPSNELWIARCLVVAAPRSGLEERLEGSVPAFLGPTRAARSRVVAHWRGARSVLPEGMADRLVLMPEVAGEPVATLAVMPVPEDPRRVDVVLRGLPQEGESAEATRARFETRLRGLAPLAGEGLQERAVRAPVWDDENRLEDPAEGEAWPAELEIRVSAKPPVYVLDRAAVAALGLEGELLLGWRGGDAVASELGEPR